MQGRGDRVVEAAGGVRGKVDRHGCALGDGPDHLDVQGDLAVILAAGGIAGPVHRYSGDPGRAQLLVREVPLEIVDVVAAAEFDECDGLA